MPLQISLPPVWRHKRVTSHRAGSREQNEQRGSPTRVPGKGQLEAIKTGPRKPCLRKDALVDTVTFQHLGLLYKLYHLRRFVKNLASKAEPPVFNPGSSDVTET